MNTTPTVIGIYGDANAIANDPGFLDLAQAEIGLNRIIFGGPFKLSPETLARNPAHKGQSHGHGLGLTDDDTPLRRAIDEAHRRGIQVWHIISTYWAGAEDAPERMARDLRGRRMDEYPRLPYADEQWSYTFCPSNEQTNAWFEAAQVELATRYEFDGCALTHHRFCHAAFYPELLACGCPSCAEAAGQLGYDFARMKTAALRTADVLQHASAAKLRRAASLGLGLWDFLQWLGEDGGGLVDWFNFRADCMTRNLRRFRGAVRAARPDFAFGSDTHFPSLALLVGHRYRDFAAVCDHILPLLPHVAIHCLDVLAAFATALTHWADGLSEAEALQLVYQLFGYENLGLPPDIAGLHLGNASHGEPQVAALSDLVASELVKARLLAGDGVPSYPVIKGAVWDPHTVRRLIDAAREAGHTGVVFQGTAALFENPRS